MSVEQREVAFHVQFSKDFADKHGVFSFDGTVSDLHNVFYLVETIDTDTALAEVIPFDGKEDVEDA